MALFEADDDDAEESDALDYGDDLDEEFRAGVTEAFPELSPEQVSALKAAVEACVQAKLDQKSGGSGGGALGGGKAKPKGMGGLALIFGPGPGKAGKGGR